MFVQVGDNSTRKSGDVLKMQVEKIQIEMMAADSTQIFSDDQFMPFVQ